MTINRDGDVIAFHLDEEIVCPQCATETDRAASALEESLAVEELAGAVDELWCDRCGAQIFSSLPI